jgi:hypothetical protein
MARRYLGDVALHEHRGAANLDAANGGAASNTTKDALRVVSPVWFRFFQRQAKPGVLLRRAADEWRVWDLSAILPS